MPQYETFMWITFGMFCLLAIIDRFWWNLWPRQALSIGGKSAGSDLIGKLKEVLGRFDFTTYAPALAEGIHRCPQLTFVTRCKILMMWACETPIATHMIVMDDHVNAI